MGVVRWVLFGLVAAFAVGSWAVLGVSDEANENAPARFHCPMHPQIRSSVQGNCPICGMRLEPISDASVAATSSAAPAVESPPRPAADSTAPLPAPSGVVPIMVTLARRQTIGLSTQAARTTSVGQERRFPAVVEVPRSSIVEAHARSAGFVEWIAPLETGARVRAGEPLAYIYSPDVLRAQAELRGAEALAGATQATDRSLVDAARERLGLLGASTAPGKAKKPNGGLGISAPISGVVTARGVSRGAYVAPETAIFEVTDYGRLWATATMSPQEAAEVSSETHAVFRPNRSSERFAVALDGVAPAVTTTTRTSAVRFALTATDGLLPGQIGEVVIEAPPTPRLLVPRDAVVDLGTRAYVFVDRGAGVFEPRTIEAGPLIGDERVVLRGLADGERVVVRGAFLLDSESRLDAAMRATETAP
jgi:RND family efflux transporter MFP subunit